MKVVLILLVSLAPVLARDITTLDGRTFPECTISRVYPDSICVLFSGGGARINFTNLSETVRMEFAYEEARATAFARSEATRIEREQAFVETQRRQLAAQRQAAKPTNAPPPTVAAAASSPTPFQAYPGGSGVTGLQGAYNGSFGNQNGNRITGAEYVGVRMAWPGGGVRGIVATPAQPRPGITPASP
jgi:hypothetical protein